MDSLPATGREPIASTATPFPLFAEWEPPEKILPPLPTQWNETAKPVPVVPMTTEIELMLLILPPLLCYILISLQPLLD